MHVQIYSIRAYYFLVIAMLDLNKLHDRFNNFRHVLCSFHALFDMEDALIRYILDNYKDSKYIKPEAYNYSDFYRHYLLSYRKLPNPLTVIFKKEYFDQIDLLIEEMMKNHYEEIVDLSTNTQIINVMDLLRPASGLDIEILCRDDLQAKKVRKEMETFSSVKPEEIEDINKYFCFIYRDYEDVLDYVYKGKTFYFLDISKNYVNWDFSFDLYKKALDEHIIAYMGLNIIKLLSPYANLMKPID